MRIERVLSFIETLGPGRRLCIWTNGCPRHCPGCVSKRLQKVNKNKDVEIEEFFKTYDIGVYDGVTISGGDPFMDSTELLHLLTYLKEHGAKDILVYTGYTYEEIMKDQKMKACLALIDVLIDGPYIDALNDNKDPLRGSTNQNILYFNKEMKEKYEKYQQSHRRQMEEYRYESYLVGVGIPTREYIEEFKGVDYGGRKI